jgi:hypothetical protein
MTTSIAARYTTRQMTAAMKLLIRERGEGWARDLPRADFMAAFEDALVRRFGEK